MHRFLTNLHVWSFHLFVQPKVVGMFLFNHVFVPCFGVELLPTYGFGFSALVQPEVVGRFFVAFIGTGISCVSARCAVCQAIPAIVHVYAHVVMSCYAV